MAHFYGITKGSRGEASRLGSKVSGLEVQAASWSGKVVVSLWCRYDGVDMATVSLAPHHGNGTSRTLYDGPVSGCQETRSCLLTLLP
jgi:hypothetical protein